MAKWDIFYKRNSFLRRLFFAIRIFCRVDCFDYSNTCPYCSSSNLKLIQRKYWFLQLRKCNECSLMFRFPKDTNSYSVDFYNKYYIQETDLTTTLPNLNEISSMKSSNFVNTTKDFSSRIAMLKRLTTTRSKLLEFGSSWGYFLYQATIAGFNCCGIELSKARAKFGKENLNVTIFTDYKSIANNSINIIYSCHVLEHLSNLKESFQFFIRVLEPNGLLIIECPNCSSKEAKELGVYWGPMIGEVHVNAITPEFLSAELVSLGFEIRMTTDLEEINELETFLLQPQEKYNLQGPNLILIGRATKK